ncbi:MAG: hypothetical protein ACKPKO_45290, partial [Candidatus Fonsibacter sp.]
MKHIFLEFESLPVAMREMLQFMTGMTKTVAYAVRNIRSREVADRAAPHFGLGVASVVNVGDDDASQHRLSATTILVDETSLRFVEEYVAQATAAKVGPSEFVWA